MIRKILLASLVTAVTALAVPTAFADATTAPSTQPEGRRHPLEKVREAVEKLNLSADQKTQIHQIIEDAREQLKPILDAAKSGGDRDKARDQVHAIVKDTIKKVSDVLTEEQKAKLRELIKDERGERPAKK